MIMDINKPLAACPKCGGAAVVSKLTFCHPEDESVEIQCMKCGLTMNCDAETVYAVSGKSITLSSQITWSYRGQAKSAIDVWNDGICIGKREE